MDLNQLVYTRLSTDGEIAGMLAEYCGSPAIFNTEFPSDQQEGWGGKNQYPRISYRYDTKADPKRSSSGNLHVAIFARGDMIVTEKIEKAVRDRLKNVVMKPEGEPPFCVSWARSDVFEIEGMGIVYKDVAFDILEYPMQITTDPDPVMAMNTFLKALDPSMFLIGFDQIEESFEPTDALPAVYVRAAQFRTMQETYALVYVYVDLYIHFLAPTTEGRLVWARTVFNELFRRGEIPYSDNGKLHPMLLEDITANNGADYLREGQLKMRGMFTMISQRVRGPEQLLNHAYFNVEDEEPDGGETDG